MDVVAVAMTEYAKGHVDLIQKEYERQLAKWDTQLGLIADAQAAARTDVDNALTEIKRQKEEMDRVMMLATSIILAGVATWVGAVIELKLYPRYMSKKVWHTSFGKAGLVVKTETEYSEMAAKFFGDFTHEQLGHVFDKAVEKVWPEPEKTEDHKISAGLANAVSTGGVATFKTVLAAALNDERQAVYSRLGTLSGNINTYFRDGDTFGDLVMREVRERYPTPRGIAQKDKERIDQENARRMLDEYFDALRAKFAAEWFYYGNNPHTGSLPYEKFNFGVAFWANFMLTQEWKMKYVGTMSENTEPIPIYVNKEDDDIDLESVMKALRSYAGAQIYQDLITPKPPKKPLGPKGATIQEIDVDIEQTDETARKAVMAGQWEKDSDAELKAMIDWASNVPLDKLKGRLAGDPRRIGSVRNPAEVLNS